MRKVKRECGAGVSPNAAAAPATVSGKQPVARPLEGSDSGKADGQRAGLARRRQAPDPRARRPAIPGGRTVAGRTAMPGGVPRCDDDVDRRPLDRAPGAVCTPWLHVPCRAWNVFGGPMADAVPCLHICMTCRAGQDLGRRRHPAGRASARGDRPPAGPGAGRGGRAARGRLPGVLRARLHRRDLDGGQMGLSARRAFRRRRGRHPDLCRLLWRVEDRHDYAVAPPGLARKPRSSPAFQPPIVGFEPELRA